jgi:L-lactate dehydrogenase complex protein LldG
MISARDEVLGRVRAALRDVPAGEEPPLQRDYARAGDAAAAVDRFAERVADYRATVRRVPVGDVAAAVAEACAQRGARRLVVPADLPDAWRPEGVELRADEELSHRELDSSDGTLTGCALAIAETGTIVLDSGPGQGRRALTLIPDFHVCVVEAQRIVASVPEAIAALHDAAREGRPITFVSGPSATSDIELRRVHGVHGPRTLTVLIAEAG